MVVNHFKLKPLKHEMTLCISHVTPFEGIVFIKYNFILYMLLQYLKNIDHNTNFLDD